MADPLSEKEGRIKKEQKKSDFKRRNETETKEGM